MSDHVKLQVADHQLKWDGYIIKLQIIVWMFNQGFKNSLSSSYLDAQNRNQIKRKGYVEQYS